MKKKALALLLSIVLIFSISLPSSAAAYSDLPEGYWAKVYIEDLVSKGYMSGYENGTIRPENNMTICESLALLSRFYALTELQSSFIQSDYKDFISSNVPSSLSWAYDELSVCLAAGIVTLNELQEISLTSAIEKERLSVFLVRAMKMEESASSLNNSALTFNDSDKITASYKPHVALLSSLGVINGDTDNNFNPHSSVTRAIVAKMVSVSLDYIKKNGITLSIDSYKNLSQQECIISAVSGQSISVYDFDGLIKVINVPSEATVSVNGTSKSLTSDYVGCYAMLTASNGSIIDLAIESSSSVKWIQGVVASTVKPETSSIYVSDSSGTGTSYRLSSSVSATQDGASVNVAGITKGYFVTMRLENNTVTKITSVSGNVSLTGTVTQISYGTTIALNLTDNSGTNYRFTFDISNVPTITRGSKTITIDRIQTGDNITLTIKCGTVTAMAIADTGTTVSGEITSIVNTTTGTSWTIKKSDGSSVTYALDSTVPAYSGTTTIALSNIKVGDTVSVVVYGSTINEVSLQSSGTPTNQVTGSVLLVNSKEKTITVLTPSGTLIYLSTSSLNWIIPVSGGSSISLSSLAVGSQITAYGSYSGTSNFTAKIIIVLG